jgi:hypothetical protein
MPKSLEKLPETARELEELISEVEPVYQASYAFRVLIFKNIYSDRDISVTYALDSNRQVLLWRVDDEDVAGRTTRKREQAFLELIKLCTTP